MALFTTCSRELGRHQGRPKKPHAYIIPRLYERVEIRLFNPFEVTRFIRCVAAGADMNLRHTRTLVIEDERKLPNEPESIHSGQLALPTMFSNGDDDYGKSERDIYLSTILSVFPQHGVTGCHLRKRATIRTQPQHKNVCLIGS
jgi:hypothetical protein